VAADLLAARQPARQRARGRQRRAVLAGTPAALLLAAGALGPALGVTPDVTLQDVCHSQGDPSAASYPSGHAAPVDFESTLGFDSQSLSTDLYEQGGTLVTSESTGEPPSWIAARPSDVQLVACVAIVPSTNIVTSCPYGYNNSSVFGSNITPLTTVDVYDQAYTITLHAARTGKVLTTATVNGSDHPACPDSITMDNGVTPGPWYASLTVSDIQSVIGPYVTS
jgi:hypothetical protein